MDLKCSVEVAFYFNQVLNKNFLNVPYHLFMFYCMLQLYVLLLELEDAFDPQAMEASAESAAARALRDPPETEPEPEKASPEELIQRMTSVLLQGDKICGFMGIRKGKVRTILLKSCVIFW